MKEVGASLMYEARMNLIPLEMAKLEVSSCVSYPLFFLTNRDNFIFFLFKADASSDHLVELIKSDKAVVRVLQCFMPREVSFCNSTFSPTIDLQLHFVFPFH